MPEQRTTEFVEGMTCRACELRIQKAVGRMPGVTGVVADARRGVVRITVTSELDRKQLAGTLKGIGYRLGGRRAWFSRDPQLWRDVALSVVAVAALLELARLTGLTRLAGSIGTPSAAGGMLLAALLGVAAGFSTCMAMVGGLVLAVSARHQAIHGEEGRAGRFRPHIAFNAGRVVGFALLGALTGVVGTVLTLSGTALAIAILVAAAVMTLVGLQLTAVSPRLAGLAPTLPAWLTARTRRAVSTDKPDAAPSGTESGLGRDLRSAGLGAVSFFLPCGFTQAVQLYALSTGSPLRAGAIMGAFALGTTPGLLSIGGVTLAARQRSRDRLFRLAGVAVLAFAIINVGGALRVLAPGFGTWGAPVASTVSKNVTLSDGVQLLAVTQGADGYSPSQSVVYAGTPVRWEVSSTALTCGAWLVSPEMGVPANTILDPGKTAVFEFTPTKPGTLHYACGMGMYSGSVRVIADPR